MRWRFLRAGLEPSSMGLRMISKFCGGGGGGLLLLYYITINAFTCRSIHLQEQAGREVVNL